MGFYFEYCEIVLLARHKWVMLLNKRHLQIKTNNKNLTHIFIEAQISRETARSMPNTKS